MRSLHAGPVRLALLIAALALASSTPRADAAAQTTAPDPAAKIHVESLEVNLTVHPAFQFVVAIPTALRFESGTANGQQYLHIWAYSRVDSLEVRIRKASLFLATKPGIFSPLIEPPNTGEPSALESALRVALRPLGYAYTLKYKRLT